MAKELPKTKTDEYDLAIISGVDKEIKKGMTKEEMVELKSYSIKKVLKLKKYVRN